MSRLYKQQVVEQINSWDIFDTLLFRLCKDPFEIFKQVENKFPSFVERRIESEKKNGLSFDTIYETMKSLYGYSDSVISEMKQEEFKAELDNIYPIVAMIEQVKSEDILVSDMYYSESIIRLFLQKSGTKLNNKIFVSSGGKSTGVIWNVIRNMGYSIRKHTGDNPVSDGKIPEKFGIPSRLVNISVYTPIEKMICENVSKDLSNIMRYVRLLCPVPKDANEANWYILQSQYNIPILIAYANIIHKKYEGKVKYFIARDTYYLYKIYRILYPDDECEYVYSSRMALYFPTENFIGYIKGLFDKHNNAIWIDLHGSGMSFNSFFSKYIGEVPKIYFCIGSSNTLPNIESIMVSNDYIEVLNEPLENSLIFYETPLKTINSSINNYRFFTNYCMTNLLRIIKNIELEDTSSIDLIKNLYSSINYSSVPYKNLHSVYHYDDALKTLEDNSPKTHLLLFGTDGLDGGINLTNESNFIASNIGSSFDVVVQLSPSNSKHLGVDFGLFYKDYPEYKTKKEHNRTNSVGFCAWKPWIILKYLESMVDGEILLYHDTNCSRHPYYGQSQKYMKGYLQFLLKLSGEDLSIAWDDPESNKAVHYVKQEVIEDICSGSLEFTSEYPMMCSNRIIIRKSEKSIRIIKEWENYCKKRKYMTPDFPPQLPGFKNHKHDQALLTAIIAKNIKKGNLKKNFPGYYFSGKIFNFDSTRTYKWGYEKYFETKCEDTSLNYII
jgi:hypothetical protein